MLDTLLELPFALNRHRDAPLLDERLAFLKYMQERGTSRAALRNVSGQLLHVIDLLSWKRCAMCRWARSRSPRGVGANGSERTPGPAPTFGQRATSSMWRRSGCALRAG